MKTIKKTLSEDRLAWGALLVILFLAAGLRYGLIDAPLERDEGEYAYAAQLILNGIPPYQEVFNMKLPGIYAAYALCLAVFGQTHQGIHFALLVMNAITTIGIFLLARHLVDSICACAAAASFALFSVSQSMQGAYANAEHFVILFAVIGFLFIHLGSSRKSLFKLFIGGFLLGICFTMKQHGFAFILLAAAYMAYLSLSERPFQWRRHLPQFLVFTVGVTIPFICLCLIMAITGVFKNFWFWTTDYAFTYISRTPIEKAWPRFTSKFMRIYLSANFLCILVGIGFFALFLTKKITRHHRVFLILFPLFSAISICPGFYFRPHYFILLLPCMSLLVGIAISISSNLFSRFYSNKINYSIPLLLITLCLFQSLYQQRDYLFYMTPQEITRTTYGLNPFQESLVIADYLEKNTQPEDRIAILGSEPQIFFYAKRRSATSYIYMYPMMERHQFAFPMQQHFIREIETRRPTYIIYVDIPSSWSHQRDSHNEIFKWFHNYQKNTYTLDGIVELDYFNTTVYHWEPSFKWPFIPNFSIAIFKRSGST